LDSSLLSLKHTKENSVGEPEHDTNSQQLLSPASLNSTSAEPEMLRQVQGKDDKPKTHEENYGSEKLPAPAASDMPRKRAGGKDLAALRARRMAASQPEQPSQENAVVANVDVATATKHVDSPPNAKESGYWRHVDVENKKLLHFYKVQDHTKAFCSCAADRSNFSHNT
jgi:hypothetical protein